MRLGEIVQKYREEHQLSQREFASKCDISGVALSFIERGERSNGDPYLPRIETVRKLARGMGIQVNALLAQCDDYDSDIPIGTEETPYATDFVREIQSYQTTAEAMLIQAYRKIPIEHQIEAMQAVFRIKDKYEEN